VEQAVRTMNHFADSLRKAQMAKNSIAILGVDPQLTTSGSPDLPRGYTLKRYCCETVEACAEFVAAIKIQLAFFEAQGLNGMHALSDVLKVARRYKLITIADGKRGDIDTVSAAYAEAYLGDGDFGCDAVTLNIYMGGDVVKPFFRKIKAGKGLFVCVRTSNASSVEFQDIRDDRGILHWQKVAHSVKEWGTDYVGKCGLSSVGAVVGATHPDDAEEARDLMPNTMFLVPGYGAQGAGPKEAIAAIRDDGSGIAVNASRSIMYAYRSARELRPPAAAAAAAKKMRDDLNQAIEVRLGASFQTTKKHHRAA
jgi:orotidine-5'-phosphate decarboxylase